MSATMTDNEEELDFVLTTKSQAARQKDLVLKDHALQIWGELRGIDQLDSATATRIVKAGLERLLAAIPSAQAEADKRAYQGLWIVARKLRDGLLAVWGDPAENGRSKTCRICQGSRMEHDPACPVGEALRAAKKAGL